MGCVAPRVAHAHALSWPSLYTTKAERHEGQKRKTARALELMSSVVVSPAPRVRVRARVRVRVRVRGRGRVRVSGAVDPRAEDAGAARGRSVLEGTRRAWLGWAQG